MLSIADVHVAYGRTPALKGVSLSVGPHEMVSILGRNGVGKTTLMKTIMGLLQVQSGTVVLDGEDVTRRPAHQRARCGLGYVPQGRLIFADLTVEENLLIGADLNRGRPKPFLEEVLHVFPRLRDRLRQRGGTLSGGEQQMLAIGRALVTGPKLLLLDEPSAGIQPSIIEELEDTIRSINETRGLAVLLVEQNIEFAASLAQRVYVMEKGRIAKEISPQEVMSEDIVRGYLAV